MFQSYYIFAIKSILCGLAAVFIIALPAAAKEPADPGYAKQAPMWRQIDAPTAWDYATGSAEIIVAVIDTGLDIDNEDIKNRIWTNENEISGNGIDDDKNGYADDLNGWNFIERDNIIFQDATGNQPDHEIASHGTAIAGLIAAEADNGIYGVGLNRQVRIMPLRAIDAFGSGSYENIVEAINYATDNGADVISMSFIGDVPDVALMNSLRRAYDKGIITVVAAGNNNSEHTNLGDLLDNPLYPICSDELDKENWILGVSAVTGNDTLSSYANFGPCVDLTAPGNDIYSLNYYDPLYGWSAGFGGGNYGTSYAVPLVAGSVALLKSVRPEWSNQEIIRSLLSSADDIDFYNPGYAGQIGYGRLNIGRAVVEALKEKTSSNFNIFYYISGSRINRFDLATQKNTFLINFGKPVASLDSLFVVTEKQRIAAALINEPAKSSVAIIDQDGSMIKNIVLPQGLLYKVVRLSETDNGSRVIVLGFDKFNQKSNFLFYDLSGAKKNEFSVNGEPLFFSAGSKFIVTALKSGKRINFSEFDMQGNKQANSFVILATGVDDMSVGKVLEGVDEQAVAVIRNNQTVLRYVFDFGTNSFIKDDVRGVCSRWRSAIDNIGDQSASEILSYCPDGGKFSVISAKGAFVRELELPALK